MKNLNKNVVFTALFLIVWIILIALTLLLPKKAFSENENRYLSSMPEFKTEKLLDGSFMASFDSWINDHFVFRDEWINAMVISEYTLGKREINDVIIGSDALFDKITPSEQIAESNIEGINTFAEKYSLNCYLTLIPSASEVQSEKLPPFIQRNDEAALIEKLYGEAENTAAIPILNVLRKHSDEYIFYRTDHHWTTYGAYLAYNKICNEMGISPSAYEINEVSDNFLGTLYSRSGVRFIKADTINAFRSDNDAYISVFDGTKTVDYDNIYFSEYLQKKDKYSYFLGQNQPVIILHGNCGSGKKLLIFRDSFASCLAPMFLSEFDEITLVDMRYINSSLNTILTPDDYDAALFIYSTDVFASEAVTSKLKEAE